MTEHEGGKKPRAAKSEKAQAIVGRTQWDAFVEIFAILGRGAPYFLVLAVGGFGFYKFQEAQRTAQAEATKQYEEQLNHANQALIKTYESMGSISGAQIKNLTAMLELHGTATARTQELQKSQEELRKQADELIARSDKAAREAELATAQKKQAELDVKSLGEVIARNRAELQRQE